MPATIRLKHAKEAPAKSDGKRILVDRLWPRGKSKEFLQLDAWLRDIAPSTQLRQWFGHDPAKWAEFRKRYFAELKTNPVLATLRELTAKGTVTFVYAAADTEHCNATALREYLQR
ncbi:MAG: DUF488 family protein [Proteobacteria bacterium]|nr:DUF488 family protein [Pseudomonadota bacterium]